MIFLKKENKNATFLSWKFEKYKELLSKICVNNIFV